MFFSLSLHGKVYALFFSFNAEKRTGRRGEEEQMGFQLG